MRITIHGGHPEKHNNNGNAQAAECLKQAGLVWQDLSATMQVFQSNVQRRNFQLAEDERANMHDMLDTYLDNYLLAGKFGMGDVR